jgi:TetR/AcrR family transcriptional regulator, transcriptional repressor for nem operon
MANKAPNKRGQKTRRKLLDAGLANFHASGYAATGVDAVSKAAKVPKGSFYNHFGSKEAFGAEVVDLYFERRLGKLRQFLLDEEAPPLARLRTYFDDRIAYFEKLGCRRGCMMGNLSLEIADHNEVLRHHLAEHFETWSSLFARCIAEAQAQGEIRSTTDAGLLADFVLNSWEGALLRMKAKRSIEPLETAKAMIFAAILT